MPPTNGQQEKQQHPYVAYVDGSFFTRQQSCGSSVIVVETLQPISKPLHICTLDDWLGVQELAAAEQYVPPEMGPRSALTAELFSVVLAMKQAVDLRLPCIHIKQDCKVASLFCEYVLRYTSQFWLEWSTTFHTASIPTFNWVDRTVDNEAGTSDTVENRSAILTNSRGNFVRAERTQKTKSYMMVSDMLLDYSEIARHIWHCAQFVRATFEYIPSHTEHDDVRITDTDRTYNARADTMARQAALRGRHKQEREWMDLLSPMELVRRPFPDPLASDTRIQPVSWLGLLVHDSKLASDKKKPDDCSKTAQPSSPQCLETSTETSTHSPKTHSPKTHSPKTHSPKTHSPNHSSKQVDTEAVMSDMEDDLIAVIVSEDTSSDCSLSDDIKTENLSVIPTELLAVFEKSSGIPSETLAHFEDQIGTPTPPYINTAKQVVETSSGFLSERKPFFEPMEIVSDPNVTSNTTMRIRHPIHGVTRPKMVSGETIECNTNVFTLTNSDYFIFYCMDRVHRSRIQHARVANLWYNARYTSTKLQLMQMISRTLPLQL